MNLDTISTFFKQHTTKVLGFGQVTVGALAASTGLFPDHWLHVFLLASGLLTAWRGFVNSGANP